MNGVPDEQDIAAGMEEDCNQNGVPDACESAPPPFGSVDSLPITVTSPRLAVADLDGDGRTDLAVGTAARGSYGVALLLGRGGRRFEERENRLSNSREILSVMEADLNGDGRWDLVLLDAGGVRAFLNEGSGNFGGRLTVSTLDDLSEIESADLNGDGFQDVVASWTEGDLLAVFLSRGDGTFEHLDDHVLNAPAGIELGDIDRDGDTDVVVATGDGLSLLVNPGNGVLQPPIQVGELEGNSRAPVLGELDGNDFPDVALATNSGAAVLFNQDGKTFQISNSFALDLQGREVTALAARDVDRDGDLDLVLGLANAGGAGELGFLINSGEGKFHTTLPGGLPSIPEGLHLRDLDGDGNEEILMVTGIGESIDIFWNGAGDLPLAPTFSLTQELLPLSNRFEPHSSALVDIDDDGDNDIITMDGEDRVMVLTNDGEGLFSENERYRLDGADELISLVAVDLENDGDVDIAAIDELTRDLYILLNRGDGTFLQHEESYRAGNHPVFLAAGDLNGDGFQDLVSANEGNDTVGVFLNLQDTTFASEVAFDVGDRPFSVATGDFDGDGHTDLAVACLGASRLSILRNDGEGSFGEPLDYEVEPPRYVVTADIDGDNHLDLVTANENDNSLGIFLNDRMGSFETVRLLRIGQPPRSVIAFDLNGDDLVDLATANEGADSISIAMNNGGGVFAPALSYSVGADPRYVVAGSLNGDGKADLISANHSSFDFSLFYNQTPADSTPSYLETLCTEMDFLKISTAGGGEIVMDRKARFLLPISGDYPVPKLFENARRYSSHEEFLVEVFPSIFPELTPEQYDLLVGRRATRQYYSGGLYRFRGGGGMAYGFSVLANVSSDPEERLRLDEVRSVFEMLSTVFTFAPLFYYPISPEDRREAAGWMDAGFPILTSPFRRGDASEDGEMDLTDVMVILDFLFREGSIFPCEKAADTNDDGTIDISDAISLIFDLFLGTWIHAEPIGGCGWDPTPDNLRCEDFPPCNA